MILSLSLKSPSGFVNVIEFEYLKMIYENKDRVFYKSEKKRLGVIKELPDEEKTEFRNYRFDYTSEKGPQTIYCYNCRLSKKSQL